MENIGRISQEALILAKKEQNYVNALINLKKRRIKGSIGAGDIYSLQITNSNTLYKPFKLYILCLSKPIKGRLLCVPIHFVTIFKSSYEENLIEIGVINEICDCKIAYIDLNDVRFFTKEYINDNVFPCLEKSLVRFFCKESFDLFLKKIKKKMI